MDKILASLTNAGIAVCVVLRSEIPSGMCSKLRTIAASNNRDHAPQSLLLLLARATYTV